MYFDFPPPPEPSPAEVLVIEKEDEEPDIGDLIQEAFNITSTLLEAEKEKEEREDIPNSYEPYISKIIDDEDEDSEEEEQE